MVRQSSGIRRIVPSNDCQGGLHGGGGSGCDAWCSVFVLPLSIPQIEPVIVTMGFPLSAQRTVRIQVVTFLPTTFDYWMGCEMALSVSQLSRPVHNEQLNAAPQECVQQALSLVEWAGQLRRRFGKCVQVRLVDAISLEGFWLSLRHRVRRYPAIIINGRVQPHGSGDLAKLDGFISQEVALGRQPRYAIERR